jgi:hypothetical protein
MIKIKSSNNNKLLNNLVTKVAYNPILKKVIVKIHQNNYNFKIEMTIFKEKVLFLGVKMAICWVCNGILVIASIVTI